MFLERWTVDELFEGRVAIARAVYKGELGSSDPAGVAQAALRMETEGFAAEDWEEEFISMLDRARLETELAARADAARDGGMQDDDRSGRLFEGQVFWMLTPAALPRDRDGRTLVPEDTDWLLSPAPSHRMRRPGTADRPRRGSALPRKWADSAHVLDVSAAARTAVKAEYERLVEPGPGERSGRG